jgi:hypothetical protein
MRSSIAVVSPLNVALTVPPSWIKPVTVKSTLPLPMLIGPMRALSRLNSPVLVG